MASCSSNAHIVSSTTKLPNYVIAAAREVAWVPVNTNCVPDTVRTLEDWLTWFETNLMLTLCDIHNNVRFKADAVAVADGAGNFNAETISEYLARTAGLSAANPYLEWNGTEFTAISAPTGGVNLPDATGINQVMYSNAGGAADAVAEWTSTGLNGQSLTVAADGQGLVWVDKQDKLPTTTGAAGSYMFVNYHDGINPETGAAAGGYWLPPGGPGEYLCVNAAGNLEWSAIAAGGAGTSDIPDATGPFQVMYSNAAGDPSTVAEWTTSPLTGQALVYDSATNGLVWRDKQDQIPNTTGDEGSYIFVNYHGGTGDTNAAAGGYWLEQGAVNEFLTVKANGALGWAALPGDLPDATQSTQLFFSTGAGDPTVSGAWLNPGNPNQVLSINAAGDGFAWVDQAAGGGTGTYDLPNAAAAQQLFISNGAGDPSVSGEWLAVGNSGQVLSIDAAGNIVWQAAVDYAADTVADMGTTDKVVTPDYLERWLSENCYFRRCAEQNLVKNNGTTTVPGSAVLLMEFDGQNTFTPTVSQEYQIDVGLAYSVSGGSAANPVRGRFVLYDISNNSNMRVLDSFNSSIAGAVSSGFSTTVSVDLDSTSTYGIRVLNEGTAGQVDVFSGQASYFKMSRIGV